MQVSDGELLCNYIGMTRTVLLHCPISPEIRTVDSQSDLKIVIVMIIKLITKIIVLLYHILWILSEILNNRQW